jgi:hypothetical protein
MGMSFDEDLLASIIGHGGEHASKVRRIPLRADSRDNTLAALMDAIIIMRTEAGELST